jgi:hypothetical protein
LPVPSHGHSVQNSRVCVVLAEKLFSPPLKLTLLMENPHEF